jgi:AcrR family transcriptional regulator
MRTFFRYFASRDEILAALPRRQLERVSDLVRDRPHEEGLIAAFSAGITQAQQLDDESDMVLLWGIAIHRSPDSAMLAMAHCAVSMSDTFQALVAERLGVDRNDQRVAALAAALSGLVGFAYSQWVLEGGKGSLAAKLNDAFTALDELR